MSKGRPGPEEAVQEDILTSGEAAIYTKRRNRAASIILMGAGVVVATNCDVITLSPLVNMVTQASLAVSMGRLWATNSALLHHDNAVKQFPAAAEFVYKLDETADT